MATKLKKGQFSSKRPTGDNRSLPNRSNIGPNGKSYGGLSSKKKPEDPIKPEPLATNGQKYQIGNDVVSKAQYDAYKARAGFSMPAADRLKPEVQQIIKDQVEQERAAIAADQQMRQDAVNSLGLTSEQQAQVLDTSGGLGQDLDILTQAAKSGAGAAAIGAAAGSVVPALGTAVGAGAGFAIGFVGGAFKALGSEKKQDVKTARATALGAYSNMQWIINEVNLGRMSPSQASFMWDQQMAKFRSSQALLKQETDSVVADFTDAQEELAKIEQISERLEQEQIRLEVAILAPNPKAVQLTQTLESLYGTA